MNTPEDVILEMNWTFDSDPGRFQLWEQLIKPAMIRFASLNRQGWTRVEDGLPEDSESVWFYCPKYNAVGAGKFYERDYFKRENVFISNDGGHYLLEDVSHYMINKKPLPPLDATTK